jgi:hypothetical protein
VNQPNEGGTEKNRTQYRLASLDHHDPLMPLINLAVPGVHGATDTQPLQRK